MKLLWDTQKNTIKIKPRNFKGSMTEGLCESNQKNYNVHLQKEEEERITVLNKRSVMLTLISIFALPLSSCVVDQKLPSKKARLGCL